MRYLIMLSLFICFKVGATSLIDGEKDKSMQSRFYLKTKIVFVDITNNSKETRQLKGLVFNQTGATFAVRFRDKDSKILKISEGSLNRDGFVSSNVLSSQIYSDDEIPKISLSPQQKITVQTSIKRIIWHLSEDSIDLISQNGVEWQFTVSFSSSNRKYNVNSKWFAVSPEDLIEKN